LSPVRVIDENGTMLGVVSTSDAMQRARDVGMDLVEISPNERPPVCKIMDYGKHKYLQSKKHKQKHHEQKLKEVRIRPKTDPHDRSIKMAHARGFLEQGDKVLFTMLFRGRERFHQDIGDESFNDIITNLVDIAKVEQPPKTFGRRMTMVLVPLKVPAPGKPKVPGGNKAAKAPKAKPPRSAPAPEEGAATDEKAGQTDQAASPAS
jgi:translation initiation factor IF-3